jgi:hypothetical protein
MKQCKQKILKIPSKKKSADKKDSKTYQCKQKVTPKVSKNTN